MPKRPSFQWYPSDWRNDLDLQACSLSARGLWMEMLNLMHISPRYGYLVVAKMPSTSREVPPEFPPTSREVPRELAMSSREVARAVGATLKEVNRLLDELELHNVFSRTEDGTIYSRRMVHDEHLRIVRAEAGAKGAATTNGRLPETFPTRLPTSLPDDLPQQNGQQNSSKSSRARAPSSSSSFKNSQSVIKSASVGELPAVAIADVPRNGAHPSEIDSRIEARRLQLAQLSATGPPDDTDDDTRRRTFGSIDF
jgi:hypothetical protein